MAADIYTKAFAGAPEWQTVCKLINHVVPSIFWSGVDPGRKVLMPSQHKGGVQYTYWTPNPWHDQPEDRGLNPQSSDENDVWATAVQYG